MSDKLYVDISAIALSGLERAQTKFDSSAAKLSRAGLEAGDPESAATDTVDLSEAVVGLITARDNYQANLKVVKTADEMQKHTLDILG